MAGVVQTDVNDLVEQTAKQLKSDGASDELIALDRTLRAKCLTIAKHEPDAALVKASTQSLMCDFWKKLPEQLRLESEKIPFALTEAKIDGMANVFSSPWYRCFLNCKPVEILKQIKIPVLALYGGNDWIASAQPSISIISEALETAGNNDFKVIEFTDLNHSFQRCKTGALAEYATIKEPIDLDVLKTISEWVLDQQNRYQE